MLRKSYLAISQLAALCQSMQVVSFIDIVVKCVWVCPWIMLWKFFNVIIIVAVRAEVVLKTFTVKIIELLGGQQLVLKQYFLLSFLLYHYYIVICCGIKMMILIVCYHFNSNIIITIIITISKFSNLIDHQQPWFEP